MAEPPPIPPPGGYRAERESLRRARHEPDAVVPPRPPGQEQEPPDDDDQGPVPVLAPIGAGLAIVLALIPHLAASFFALVCLVVAIPTAWYLARLSSGRRRAVLLATLGLCVLALVLAIAMPFVWERAGVITFPWDALQSS